MFAPAGRETDAALVSVTEDDEEMSTTALEISEDDDVDDSEQAKNIAEIGKTKTNLQFIQASSDAL